MLSIAHHRTTSYHSCANGMVERFHASSSLPSTPTLMTLQVGQCPSSQTAWNTHIRKSRPSLSILLHTTTSGRLTAKKNGIGGSFDIWQPACEKLFRALHNSIKFFKSTSPWQRNWQAKYKSTSLANSSLLLSLGLKFNGSLGPRRRNTELKIPAHDDPISRLYGPHFWSLKGAPLAPSYSVQEVVFSNLSSLMTLMLFANIASWLDKATSIPSREYAQISLSSGENTRFTNNWIVKGAMTVVAEILFWVLKNKDGILSAIADIHSVHHSANTMARRVFALSLNAVKQLNSDMNTCKWFSIQ
ncbi:unnamed protein product [Lepeophtheirus salmonis]|uniref:(salmon louse) hypothetical protein n=1 Tax=Lepeophtheirus salmonis TaxID=72036 RepID=A0A7R8CWG4_LEPSM|nr:unnamed protein product [Lepeophtheirus salmonis]CAF2920716.1 unnamed protein product [Lepeophtheirus salmonis]